MNISSIRDGKKVVIFLGDINYILLQAALFIHSFSM